MLSSKTAGDSEARIFYKVPLKVAVRGSDPTGLEKQLPNPE